MVKREGGSNIIFLMIISFKNGGGEEYQVLGNCIHLAVPLVNTSMTLYFLALMENLRGAEHIYTGWPVKHGHVFLLPCKK